MKKRLLALLLSAALILSLTTPVLAENDPAEGTTDTQQTETCDSCGNALHEGECPPAEPDGENGSESDGDNANGEGVNTPAGDSENNTNTTNDENVNNENGEDGQPGEDGNTGDTAGDDTQDNTGDDTKTPPAETPVVNTPETQTPPANNAIETVGTTCATCGKEECTCVKVGDKIWIKSGSYVYKTQSAENGWPLIGNYKVKVVEIITDENGDVELYKFEFTSLGLGELLLHNYKYVAVENTSVEEPEEEDLPSVSVEGDIPEGVSVSTEVISEDDYHEDVSFYTAGSAPVFSLDIELKDKDGEIWQPEEGNYVTVSVAVDKEDGTTIGVLHVHNGEANPIGMYGDYKVENGMLTFETDGFSEFYGYIVADTYVRDEGEFFANAAPLVTAQPAASRIRTFGLRSASDGSESNIVLNKTVAPDAGNEFTLTLEAFATGTSGTVTQVPTPSDIVLVLDESGSMNDCIECNHEIYESRPAEEVTFKNVEDNFVGHRVYPDKNQAWSSKNNQGEIWTYKQYKIIYPGDNSVRTVTYCESHDGWYSTEHNADGKHTGAKWVPFTSAGQTPTNDKNVSGETTTTDKWICKVQFYCVCNHSTERIDALKTALTSFVEGVYEDSVEDGVNNRIAIATYGDASNKALCYTSEDETNWEAAEAFWPITTEVHKNALLNIVKNKVKVRSATPTHVGIQAAEDIFEANPIPTDEKRNRVMILFTDGAPGSGYKFYDGKYSATEKDDWTNPGIASANTIKNGYGATVYTVGLFPGANASTPSVLPKYTAGKEGSGQHNAAFFENANRFLHLVSSNYPDATSMTDTGNVNSNLNRDSYYLSTENEEGLYAIFDALSNVAQAGSTTVTLDETAYVQDIVTPDFEIPEIGDKALVTAWTETFTGYDNTGNRKWSKDTESVSDVDTEATETNGKLDVSVNDRTIKVANFDFAENFVHVDLDEDSNEIYKGKKLVVQVKIDPVDGFNGGSYIATNTTDAAGIYTETGDVVAKFPEPHVDIPTTVTVKKVVEGSSTAKFSFDASGYDVWDRNNPYEDIPANDPRNTGANASNYLKANGTVGADSCTFELGDNGEYLISDVLVGSTITISEAASNKYHLVKVEVNGNPITADQNGAYTIEVTPGMTITFTNARTLADLKITKTGADPIDEYQSFIFDVKNSAGTVISRVVVHGNGSVVLKDLPAEKYTVAEAQDWSWRYDKTTYDNGAFNADLTAEGATKSSGATVDLAANGNMQVLVTNERTDEQWIDGNNWCQNIFKNGGIVEGEAIVNDVYVNTRTAAVIKEDDEENET